MPQNPPLRLKMVVFGEGRFVFPTELYLQGLDVDCLEVTAVLPARDPPVPLPAGIPFVFVDKRKDDCVTSLTIREEAFAAWELVFSLRTKLILTVRSGTEERNLRVDLTHVRIVPADFELLLIDAAAAKKNPNDLARFVFKTWARLREDIPHYIPPPEPPLGRC